jgi:hypothetical protein
MKPLEKMTKKELIAKLQHQEKIVSNPIHHSIINSSITVNPNKGKDSKTLNILSEAILTIARTLEKRSEQPVYGVYFSNNKNDK